MPPGMKLTKIEKAWVLYDVGNSAFILLVSTLFPIYFNAIAQQAGISDIDYLAYWGYAVSAVTIIVAVSGPVLGAMTDFKGFKNRFYCQHAAGLGRLLPFGFYQALAFVSCYFCHCKVRFFCQPYLL